MIEDIFNFIGGYGPFMMIIISLFLLRHLANYRFIYIMGTIFSLFINFILKALIKKPRPNIDEKTYKTAINNSSRFIFKKGLPHDIFGMPSGHSQGCWFTTIFVFMVLKDYQILALFVVWSIVTMFQRVYFGWHTVFQVIVGGVVGGVLGYIIYRFEKEKIKGEIKEKEDDNAPKNLNI